VKGAKVTSVRTRVTVRAFEMAKKYEKKQEEWIVAKFWPPSQEVIVFEAAQGKKEEAEVEQEKNT